MKKTYPNKFLFTQLSAPIIGFVGFFLLLRVTKVCFPELFDLESGSLFFIAAVFIALLLFSLLVSMFVWGRILVFLGILTKEEAKGYPYSKPWGKKRID
jgi:hypothetical protein